MSYGDDRTSTVRGAVSGALAAAVWGATQPLDKRIFDSRFDDVELLGKAVTRGDRWYPIGFGIHLANGAVFGAIYTRVAPSLPLPARLRGPALALAEHLATWPLVALTDRVHPARDQLPRAFGSRSAFLQETWRHLLFGFLLGEIDRRLQDTPPQPEEAEEPVTPFSSNGHGSLEHALSSHPDA